MRRDERGSAALEFGLVAAAFLMLVLGIVQYGYQFWSLTTAAATAREAARKMVVGNDWATCALPAALSHAGMPAVDAAPEVTYRFTDDTGLTLVGPPRPGDRVEVTVRFQSLALNLPFLPLPDHGMVEQTAVDEVENVPASVLSCDTPGNQ